MPPTRGHDLKLTGSSCALQKLHDAPHTGARLETMYRRDAWPALAMPPTRGHDLKLAFKLSHPSITLMPPTRGHDLKHQQGFPACWQAGCPPHGGTT